MLNLKGYPIIFQMILHSNNINMIELRNESISQEFTRKSQTLFEIAWFIFKYVFWPTYFRYGRAKWSNSNPVIISVFHFSATNARMMHPGNQHSSIRGNKPCGHGEPIAPFAFKKQAHFCEISAVSAGYKTR